MPLPSREVTAKTDPLRIFFAIRLLSIASLFNPAVALAGSSSLTDVFCQALLTKAGGEIKRLAGDDVLWNDLETRLALRSTPSGTALSVDPGVWSSCLTQYAAEMDEGDLVLKSRELVSGNKGQVFLGAETEESEPVEAQARAYAPSVPLVMEILVPEYGTVNVASEPLSDTRGAESGERIDRDAQYEQMWRGFLTHLRKDLLARTTQLVENLK